jgi:hypothetical protein
MPSSVLSIIPQAPLIICCVWTTYVAIIQVCSVQNPCETLSCNVPTPLQALSVHESNMQMCRECSVCSVKTQKLAFFISLYIANIAWVTRGDRKTAFFGAKLQKNVYTTFNFSVHATATISQFNNNGKQVSVMRRH